MGVVNFAIGIAYHKAHIYRIPHCILEVNIHTGTGNGHVLNDTQSIEIAKQAIVIRVYPDKVQAIDHMLVSVKGSLECVFLFNTDNRPSLAGIRQ